MVWSCRENGPNATTKNYDSLETGRKETTKPSLENLERWNIYSHEWKRSKNGRMEQSKAMEYESRKASSDVLKPRYIYFALTSGAVFPAPHFFFLFPLSSPSFMIKGPYCTSHVQSRLVLVVMALNSVNYIAADGKMETKTRALFPWLQASVAKQLRTALFWIIRSLVSSLALSVSVCSNST